MLFVSLFLKRGNTVFINSSSSASDFHFGDMT